MTDIHTHILPKTDDGSRSTEESVLMLKALPEQGVSRVVATPHFYANDESVESFLERRQRAFESLSKELTPEMPEILLGAEVKYYEGISRLNGLKQLGIAKTGLLLLEMPECRWTEYTLRELADISSNGKSVPVIAHVERCMNYQKPETLYRLLQGGILMQINAGFVNGILTRRKALRLLENGKVHFIGSDCHNMDSRPPEAGRAFEMIRKKLGENFISDFKNFANNFFEINL